MDLVVATSNTNKLREIRAILGSGHPLLPQSDFGGEPVQETGLTFVENAILKARHASRLAGLPAIADDSGLEVDILHGQPGVRSARYAGPDATDADNLNKLLEALEGIPEGHRNARFQCVIVYLSHPTDPTPRIFQGTWEGRILDEPRGTNGFGYDPVFYCPESRMSAAELSAEVKNRVSHRARALAGLKNCLG